METEYSGASSTPATTSPPQVPTKHTNVTIPDKKSDGRHRKLIRFITFPVVSLVRPFLRRFRSISLPPVLDVVLLALRTSGLVVLKQRFRLPLLWPAIQLLSALHVLPLRGLKKWTPFQHTTDFFQVISLSAHPNFLFLLNRKEDKG